MPAQLPPLPLQDLGGTGPLLLVLHANGFSGACYAPMAQHLRSHFRVMALDAPGQGASAALTAAWADWSAAALTAALLRAVEVHGLHGCLVFGHSLGGALALLAEAACPGTFSGIYVFEPVLQPGPLDPAQQQAQPPALPPPQQVEGRASPGSQLAAMTRRRRSRFVSQADAAARLGAKPPFSRLRPDALAAYLQHGLVWEPQEQGGLAAAAPGSAAGGTASGAGVGHQPAAHAGAGVWRLVTSPEVEARTFECFDPPPLLQVGRVQPRVLVAVGGDASGPHRMLPGLGLAVGSRLTRGATHVFPGLHHLGPLQQPDVVAAHVSHFFTSAVTQQGSACGPTQPAGAQRAKL